MKNDLDTIRRRQNGSIDISYYVDRAHQIRSNDAYRNARSFSGLICDTLSTATRFFKENYKMTGGVSIFRPAAGNGLSNSVYHRAFRKIVIPVQAGIHRSLSMIR